MKSIVRWSVDNPVAVNLLFLVILVAGALSYLSLPREVVPAIDLDQVNVRTLYPGGTAEEVERLVTERIEEAIAGIEEIKEIRSLSLQGRSSVDAEVVYGVDPDFVARRIEVEIDKIRELPEEVEDAPTVTVKRSAFPVIFINLAGTAEAGEVKHWVERLERDLMQIPGVSSVFIAGLTDPQIWVECDPPRLVAHDLTTEDVVAAVARWSVNMPGGMAEAGATETMMRTVGQATGAADLENAIVRPGSDLRIRDVAEVREARARPVSHARYNGRPSINMYVQKSSGGNAMAVSAAVRERLTELRGELPEGLTVSYTADTAEYVRARFRTVYQSGIMAVCIILAILYLLLNGRVALVTALGVPAATAGALALMPALGLSLNLFTLFAFILVLGLVVDDAIIIAENIYRRIELGEEPMAAARAGAAEVAWPVTVTVLTTLAAFFPMVFLPGLLGNYMGIMPQIVALTLGWSLFEALVILPSHVAEVTRGRGAAPSDARRDESGPLDVESAPRDIESVGMAGVRRRYRRFLERALGWRYAVIAGSFAITAVAVSFAVSHMPFVLLGSTDIPIFLVRIEAPQSAPLAETMRLVQEAEKVAMELPPRDVRAVIGWVGIFVAPNADPERGAHLGELWIELTEYDQRVRPGMETMEDLRRRFGDGIGGARRVTFRPEDGLPTPPDVEVHLRGDDWPALRAAADEIQAHLATLPGVSDVRDDDPPRRAERRVRVSPQRAALYGVDTRGLGLALQAALEGIRAASFRRDDEEVEIIVKLPEHLRRGGNFDLERLAVPARRGGSTRMVPLSEVAEIEQARGRTQVRRLGRERSITLTAEVDEDVTTPRAVQAEVAERFSPVLPPGVDFEGAGKSREMADLFRQMAKAFAVAMLFIYFMLGTLFRSFLQPFAIMMSIPFSICGVIAGFYLTGQPLDVLSSVGVVALTGIVVNDSLVLIDFVNTRRRAGMSRHQALLDAGVARFRPIILTTVTTVGGLLPLALTSTGQAAVLSPVADAICWGLSLSTVVTLVMIPCAYAVVDDLASIGSASPFEKAG